MEKRDWLLVYISLLAEKGINFMDPIRIMKGLFLFKMSSKEKIKEFYKFKPYLYGPCSFEIYSDLLRLQLEGKIAEYKAPSSNWNYYRVTDKGKRNANDILKKVSSELVELMKSIKQKLMDLSFLELLKEVYRKYPEYAQNSVINLGG